MLVSLRAVLASLLLLAINLSSASASQVHLTQGTDASGKPSITLGIDPTEGFTMVIATYKRDALLTPLLKHLTTKPPPSLRHIVVVWQNIGSPLPDFLDQRSLDQYSTSGVAVTVRQSWKNSMNERFRPILDWDQEIVTDAVMIMDDDIVLRKEALEWGYQQFVAANDHGKGRIVGFTGRDFEEKEDGTVEYIVQPRTSYSMVLSNAAWLRKEWLAKYWEDTQEMRSLRDYVDEVFNCDDILINYLVSNLTGSAPLLLQPSTPLRTVPTEDGLWNRGANAVDAADAANASSSSTPADPPRPNHFETRKLCLAHYFSHFSAFAPPPKRGRRFASAHYPLIKTSTSVSQDVQDHARWLYDNEMWETPVWTLPEPELSQEDQELLEKEEFDKLLEGMTDAEIDELMRSLEAMIDEDEGAEGELEDEEEQTEPSVYEEAARDQGTTAGHIAGEL